jgi:hypothetical protein
LVEVEIPDDEPCAERQFGDQLVKELPPIGELGQQPTSVDQPERSLDRQTLLQVVLDDLNVGCRTKRAGPAIHGNHVTGHTRPLDEQAEDRSAARAKRQAFGPLPWHAKTVKTDFGDRIQKLVEGC